MVRTVTLAVAIAALCSPLINASPLIEPTAALGSNDDLPAPSAVPQTPPTPESPPRTVDGGVLTCHASYISGDNPHFYMDRDEAVSTAQDFCSRIQPGVVFKQGGTPLQTAQDDGPYGYPMTISAIWRPFPPDRKDCPVLDFNYFNATSICQQSLVDNIIDRCNTYKGGRQFWKGGGSYNKNCIVWEMKRKQSADPGEAVDVASSPTAKDDELR